MVSKDRHENATGQTWQPSFANKVSSVAYEKRPANPSTQNMVSHSSTLGCLLEPHIEPQIRRLYGHRAIGRDLSPKDQSPSDRSPGCLLDVQLSRRFLTFFECSWTHLSSAFTQKTTFWRSISRHVTCFRLRVPRTQTPAFLDSAAFCVILEMRFQS